MPQSAPPTRTKKRMTFILGKACTLLLSNNTQTFHQPMHKNVKAVTLLVSTLYHVQNPLLALWSIISSDCSYFWRNWAKRRNNHPVTHLFFHDCCRFCVSVSIVVGCQIFSAWCDRLDASFKYQYYHFFLRRWRGHVRHEVFATSPDGCKEKRKKNKMKWIGVYYLSVMENKAVSKKIKK